jgi:hypothetical protein
MVKLGPKILWGGASASSAKIGGGGKQRVEVVGQLGDCLARGATGAAASDAVIGHHGRELSKLFFDCAAEGFGCTLTGAAGLRAMAHHSGAHCPVADEKN